MAPKGNQFNIAFCFLRGGRREVIFTEIIPLQGAVINLEIVKQIYDHMNYEYNFN